MKKKMVLSKKNFNHSNRLLPSARQIFANYGSENHLGVCVQRAVVCSAVRNIMCEFLNTATCGTAMMQWIFRANIYYLGSLQCMPP